jgi:ISXO2-like transposase domain
MDPERLDGASYVYIDQGGAMRKVGSQFEKHDSVNHQIGEYMRGPVHTNTIEGYFSIMKRGTNGEFDFRYNERSAVLVSRMPSAWSNQCAPL